jgi:hypothetical protein
MATKKKLPTKRCSGNSQKVKYPDRVSAELALLDTWRSRSSRRAETRAYECLLCNGWHLTSQPKRNP